VHAMSKYTINMFFELTDTIVITSTFILDCVLASHNLSHCDISYVIEQKTFRQLLSYTALGCFALRCSLRVCQPGSLTRDESSVELWAFISHRSQPGS
jgi:hypothetical protein